MAQSVEHPILDVGSGHDLGVLGSSSVSGSLLGGESASPSALYLPLCLLVLSLLFYKVNKIFLKNAKGKADFRVG